MVLTFRLSWATATLHPRDLLFCKGHGGKGVNAYPGRRPAG